MAAHPRAHPPRHRLPAARPEAMTAAPWTFDVLTDHAGRPIIVEVHDGDTFRVCLDVGFETAAFPWLRLDGYNAPELREPDGPAARDALLGILTKARGITVTTRKNQPRSFARYIADTAVSHDKAAPVTVAVDGFDLVGLMLLNTGYGKRT